MKQSKNNQVLTAKPIVKYLHVISSLDPEGGGTAEGVRQLSGAASGIGHDVEIATLDPPDAPWAKQLPCPVHQLGSRRLGKYGYSPDFAVWLRANARRYDAVIVNGLWQYHSFAVWRELRNTPTPYFVFTHGMLDPWFRYAYPLKHLKKWLYWPWAEYRVLRDARAVLFTCEEERRLARQSFSLYRAREAVVGLGTPGPGGDVVMQREAFLRAFPQLRARRLLLFLGRVHPKKGCDLLIEAFAVIAHHEPELDLVMAGPSSPDFQATLAQRVENRGLSSRVHWTGMLGGELKWGAFRAAEAFVLPSHQENFGIAVAEALACNVPVLISDKVNIWREVLEDRAAYVADDTLGGTTGLLHAWLNLSPFERERMSRNAGKCFRERFHIEAAANNLRNAMQSHLQNGQQNSQA